jgi:hypothetical protein
MHIVPAEESVDEWIWVVVGDVPSAYIATQAADTPGAALDAYIGAMEEWVEAARSGSSVADLIPVGVPPTEQYAELLARRLEFLDREILPTHDH